MRFRGSFRLKEQPILHGCTTDSKFKYDGSAFKLSCHEFTVDKVKSEKVEAAEVTFIAGKYVDGSLYGPASLLKDKTIIYTCKWYRCRLGCPCHLCRKKVNNCEKSGNAETCSGPCVKCRGDCDDHLLFHRAPHLNCKFCKDVLNCLPNMKFIVLKIQGYYPDFYYKPISASLFDHWYGDNDPTRGEDSSKFSCDKCDKLFGKKAQLKKHELSVHFGSKYPCMFCGLQFTRKDNLEHHMKEFHCTAKDKLVQHQCEVCREMFRKKSNLVRHAKMVRICETCSSVFCSTRQLLQHQRSIHPTYSCKDCKKSFPDRANLKRHVDGSLKEGGTRNVCEHCDLGFCSIRDLSRHNRMNHPNKCKYCGNSFSSNQNYKNHILKREDNLCTKCGKLLCSDRDLRIHINSVHNTRECRICLVSYCFENYKHHMYTEHQELIEEHE